MSSAGHHEPAPAGPGAWDTEWPDEFIDHSEHSSTPQKTFSSKFHPQESHSEHIQENTPPEPPRERHYRPRQCRICLEHVLPTYHPPSENLPGFLQSGTPRVTYESEDGGRLLRPCQCKGTAMYVHEECLKAWRYSDAGLAQRNFYECPTCGYKYRLQRLGLSAAISSVATQIALTLLILLIVTFTLGFVADPIIDFCLDPSFLGLTSITGNTRYDVSDILPTEDVSGWGEHFMKGFASLGLMSLLKTLFASPVQFFLRSTGNRNRNQGRERLGYITWIMVAVGVATFLYAIWKGVRLWVKRTLANASASVMDVHNADDVDEEEEDSS
ncbi:hypothetical protein E6O75_ATG02883 [Venturia nashicola]|uniref:RING-CH-type domain-containing protein n=1 Tax=Venturia nashicola TaxID=86259 RepID=A0A4Z1P9B8_9PEZI|nr:hypothetical protein E6O75_ATG02883 [Venturia nashicola]